MPITVFRSMTGINTHHDATAIDRSRNGKVLYVPEEYRGRPGFGAPDLTLLALLTKDEYAALKPTDQDDYTLTAGGNYVAGF